MVISVRSSELALVNNKVLYKFVLFQCFIDPLSQKALKGCINLIINSVKGQFIIEFSRHWDTMFRNPWDHSVFRMAAESGKGTLINKEELGMIGGRVNADTTFSLVPLHSVLLNPFPSFATPSKPSTVGKMSVGRMSRALLSATITLF